MSLKATVGFFALYLYLASWPEMGLSQISMAVGGYQHSVIAGPGGVCGWGTNGVGEIGIGNTVSPKPSPVAVSISGTVTKVVAGHSTTVFLKSDGTAWGCGYNEVGQLGKGDNAMRSTPVQLTAKGGAVTTFTDIACGTNQDHVLLLGTDQKVYPYGRNTDGELGTLIDGVCADYNSAGAFCHTCTNATGTNCEWSYADTYHNNVSIGNASCSAIWAGAYQSFFKKTDGSIWACGENTVGQLGDGSTTDRYSAVSIGTFAANTVSKISVGQVHTLFLKTDGTVWSSGWNQNGEVGDGTTTLRSTPVQCTALPAGTWIDIAAGGGYSLFLRSDGTVWGCGAQPYGQLADGTTATRNNPIQLGSPALLSGITMIAASTTGYGPSLFYNGTTKVLYSAGYNPQGQLGDGTTTNQAGCTQCKWQQVTVSTGSGCLPGILPVELISFTANCMGGEVKCEWSTASETNNDFFTVERSADNNVFSEIGVVNGAGHSSGMRFYSFRDIPPFPDARSQQIFYYRLKQTDHDGRFAYFSAVSAVCSQEDPFSFILQTISGRPELAGMLYLSEEAEIGITLFDVQGRTVRTLSFHAAPGSTPVSMPMADIDPGIYFYSLTSGGEYKTSGKFILVNTE